MIALNAARTRLHLSVATLWVDCFALGGTLSLEDLDAFLSGERSVSDLDHDVIVHALNERFADSGADHPLAYTTEPPRT